MAGEWLGSDGPMSDYCPPGLITNDVSCRLKAAEPIISKASYRQHFFAVLEFKGLFFGLRFGHYLLNDLSVIVIY